MEFAKTQSKLWLETEKLENFLGKAKEFTAILYVGGFGRESSLPFKFEIPLILISLAMFDLVENPVSTQLIREFYEADRIVTAVCHGSAALLNATLADGSKFIAGKKLTGFSNAEEIAVDRQKDMPFHLETALDNASEGCYAKAAEAWAPLVVVSEDKKFMTGQNPASAQGLAEALLKVIKSS
jgi:putative intracellular protease/amidase